MKRPVIRTVQEAVQHFRGADVGTPWFRRSITDQQAHASGRLPFIGHLWLAKIDLAGDVEDLGLVSCRVVTDSGVAFMVDAFQGLVEPEAMRFHGLGTGTTAEAATQTALVTELTTQYATANTRPTGTLAEAGANIYETVATITVGAAVGATEHGIFSQAATGGGIMLDRSVFAVINLAAGEALQATYRLTVPSGG